MEIQQGLALFYLRRPRGLGMILGVSFGCAFFYFRQDFGQQWGCQLAQIFFQSPSRVLRVDIAAFLSENISGIQVFDHLDNTDSRVGFAI